jgi:putative SOS response-associated peptidase YedK
VCGRYVSTRSADDLVAEFDALFDLSAGALSAGAMELPPDQNIAPTKDVYAVVERPLAADPGVVRRELRVMRWGLVPSWAPDPTIASRLINARLETVVDKPAFRPAFVARRCLLPADGYFEWQAGSWPAGRPGSRAAKQPFLIRPKDGGVLAMAGLWERWRDRDRPREDPRAWLETCTIITTVAEDSIGHLHDRMPVFLPRERWAAWLAPSATDVGELRSLLVPEPGRLEAVPVSTAVNDVRNNGPHLIEPLTEAAPVSAPDADTLF